MRTTRPDAARPCPLDVVNRQFTAPRPDRLWVADFTYISTWQGQMFVAFVIDIYARHIVGWRISSHMCTDFVVDALEQALYAPQPSSSTELIHHSSRKIRESLKLATLQWVHWFNNDRLLESIGHMPPAEAGANYWRQVAKPARANPCTSTN